ncbi:hypothetical protein PR048_025028 [Dryococelus australis]|uniref:MADF domain-containing protein n=1 Tax=Dryococelus australis TaxID=614101 RepID=A0ABQ9GQ62_9NEOP|nr:hypothetical protein PR048_025028 [Dryococelus australis]
MSVNKMTQAQIIKFVELYGDSECLWNISCQEYKDCYVRDKALKETSEEMNIDGFGPREVVQKAKNIRSPYYQEIRKISNSKKSGVSTENVCKPKVPWLDILDAFFEEGF